MALIAIGSRMAVARPITRSITVILLSTDWKDRANALIAVCEADFNLMQGWFGCLYREIPSGSIRDGRKVVLNRPFARHFHSQGSIGTITATGPFPPDRFALKLFREVRADETSNVFCSPFT